MEVIYALIVVLGPLWMIWDWSQRSKPKTADTIDKEEREFLMKNRNDSDPSSMRRYLDWKRESIGKPRRAGVNADLLAPRNDAEWTIKPGEAGPSTSWFKR